MVLQTTINRVNTFGIEGDLANAQVPHYTPTTPRVADSDAIKAGAFAWVADTNGAAVASSTGAGKPTGIVKRTNDNTLGIAEGATLEYKAGHKVDVIVWGDVFVRTTDSAAVGKKLFVNNTTGAITCGTAGASVSGATETDWVVVSLANNAADASGSVVLVSNVK